MNTLLQALVLITGFAAHAADTAVDFALNWKPEPEFGGFYQAEMSGAFKKQGLAVKIQEGGSGAPVVQMVAAGKVPFGIAAADEVVISQDHGTDVIAVFAVYKTDPQAIMVHAERGFKSLADVFSSEGQLAIAPGTAYTEFLKGRYKSGMKVKMVPYGGGIAQFLANPQHAQQCFAFSEPLLAQKAGKKTQVFSIADSGFNPYTTVVITKRSTLKSQPELVKKFVTAIRQGWMDYYSAPQAANAYMAKLNPAISAASMDEMTKAHTDYLLEKGEKKEALGVMTLSRWKELAAQLKQLKFIKKDIDPAGLFVSME